MAFDGELGWTDEQWNRVRKAVLEEAQRGRVAAQFLPLFGPNDPALVGVPRLTLSTQPAPVVPPAARLWVDSDPSLLLATIAVQIDLQSRELADPELAAALTMFRRAASIVARVEDALIFNGQLGSNLSPAQGVAGLPAVYRVTGGGVVPGLLPGGTNPVNEGPLGQRLPVTFPPGAVNGQLVADMIINVAITRLENAGQMGPFACVLAQDLFAELCRPTPALVMARDRVLPFLDGPLLRSSAIPNGYGVVLALAGGGAELVVASDLNVQFMQNTNEPRAAFRLSERLALRVKDQSCIAVLRPFRP